MSDCKDTSPGSASTVAQALNNLGPRTVEGDQGRVTMHSVGDVIAAMEYERKRSSLKSKKHTAAVLRTISGHRLEAHDGPAT